MRYLLKVFRRKVFRVLPFILGLIFALVVVLQNGAILATSTEIREHPTLANIPILERI